MVVAQINPWETDALYREIFDDRCYTNHGIEVSGSAPVVDVGANIGLATLFFHSEAPQAPIVAVEPAPEPRTALEQNVQRFAIDAKIVPAALGAKEGVETFQFYPSHTISSGIHADAGRDVPLVEAFFHNTGVVPTEPSGRPDLSEIQELTCPMKTLSEVIEWGALDTIGLLKVDAERCERAILEGIRSEHWDRIRQIVLEVHNGLAEAEIMAAALASHGMTVTVTSDALTEHILYARRA
jgi:31-O-methyltransferase